MRFTALQSLFLLQFNSLLLPIIHGSFFDPHSRYECALMEFWPAGFKNRDVVAQFIYSGKLIARERVTTSKLSIPNTSVMSQGENSYTLFDFLYYMNEYRGGQVVILVIESAYDLRKAQWTLINFNRKWIWLQVAVSQGPQGDEPTLDGDSFRKEIDNGYGRHIWIVYEMTTKPTPPYGYTPAHLKTFSKVPFTGVLSRLTSVMLLDIVHASHSSGLFPDGTMKMMKYVIFQEKPNTIRSDINIDGVQAIIDNFGIEHVYLDVSSKIREEIMKKYEVIPEKKLYEEVESGAGENIVEHRVWLLCSMGVALVNLL